MNKRVAFLISDQHLKITGGIGTFLRGFLQYGERCDVFVDLLVDKKPTDSDILDYIEENHNINILYPENPLSYANHNSSYVFRDGFNMEKSINFRTVLLDAMKRFYYDAIVINSPEGIPAVYNSDLPYLTRCCYMSHLENIIRNSKESANNIFNKNFSELILRYLNSGNMIYMTQNEKNRDDIKDSFGIEAKVAGMWLPETELFKGPGEDQEGVLFIGRWEPRKQPEVFLDMIAQTNLKAKIISKKSGLKKWEEALKKRGIENYEIKCNISGKEKSDFIRGAKYAFHSSRLEACPFSVQETLLTCPTFALEYDWTRTFGDDLIKGKNISEIAQMIESGEYEFDQNILERYREYERQKDNEWNDFLNSEIENNLFQKLKEGLSIQRILQENNGSLDLYSISEEMSKNASYDTVYSIIKYSPELHFYHTKDMTLVSFEDMTESEIDNRISEIENSNNKSEMNIADLL